MGIRDCAKKECQEEASVDEDTWTRILCLLPHLYYYFLFYSVLVVMTGGHGYKQITE